MTQSSRYGTLSALIQTAEWSVDAAQVSHGDALRVSEQSQQALGKAQQDLDASHERLRQLMSGAMLDANMLQYQQLQITHYQIQLSVCDRQHLENMHRVEAALHELLSAKINAETYTRLKNRRENEEARIEKQQVQWLADESGVTRSAIRDLV